MFVVLALVHPELYCIRWHNHKAATKVHTLWLDFQVILALALRNWAISEGFIFLTLNGKAVFDKSANLLCLLFGNLTTAKHHAVEEIAQTAYKMDTTAHLSQVQLH